MNWRALAGRVGWGLADQGCSSLTNLALAVVIARAVTPDEFGAFAIVFATYTIALGLYRSVSTEPLVVRYTSENEAARRRASAAATGVALSVGIIGGTACVLVGLLVHGPLGNGILALGLVLPALLVQDAWRFTFFAAGSPASAFVNDLLWGTALIPIIGGLILLGLSSFPILVMGWGLAAAVAAVFGIAQTGMVPRPQDALGWWKDHSDLAPRFLLEFLAMTGAGQLTVYGIGVAGGLAATGAIRAVNILLGPINVLGQATGIVGVPETIRILQGGRRPLRHAAISLSLGMVVLTLLWGGIVLLIPAQLGRELLGSTWSGAEAVRLPLVLALVANVANAGAATGLRALAAARRSLRARIIVSVIGIILAVGGAVTAGVQGAAWGMVASAAIGSVIWWVEFRAALSEYQPGARFEAVTVE